MKKSIFAFILIGIVSLSIFVVWWFAFAPRSEKFTAVLGCFDYFMIPANETNCVDALDRIVVELKDKGYQPDDCRYLQGETLPCQGTFGYKLVCTYECGP